MSHQSARYQSESRAEQRHYRSVRRLGDTEDRRPERMGKDISQHRVLLAGSVRETVAPPGRPRQPERKVGPKHQSGDGTQRTECERHHGERRLPLPRDSGRSRSGGDKADIYPRISRQRLLPIWNLERGTVRCDCVDPVFAMTSKKPTPSAPRARTA